MTEEERRKLFHAINAKRFGPPSSWTVKGRPKGWHLDRPITPNEASMHDNGINDALTAINEFQTATRNVAGELVGVDAQGREVRRWTAPPKR